MTKRSNAKENGRIEVVLCWEMTATSDQRSITCPTTTVGKKKNEWEFVGGEREKVEEKRWEKRSRWKKRRVESQTHHLVLGSARRSKAEAI